MTAPRFSSLTLGILGLSLAIAGAPRTTRGDLFLLASGGQIEGTLVNREEVPRQNYVVQLASGGQVSLAKKMVTNVVVRSEAERRYEELLPKMPTTVEGHWKMAEWCKERGLESLRETHLREIIQLDPEHEAARVALGYSRVKGKWQTVAEFYTSQGYVRHGTTWRLPQEVAMLTAQEQAKREEIEWRQKLRILRGKLERKGGDRALEELRAIRHPAAAPALAAMLDDHDENRELRLLIVDLLGQIDSGAAIGALVKHAIQSDDSGIREQCLDQLERRKSPQITTALIRMLRDENNVVVQRAALALGRLKDPAATLPLIDALTTKHKQVLSTGGGSITPSFSADGGAGLSMGGGPKVVLRDVSNDSVLAALTALHPGVNLGFDKAAWKRWYAEAKAPKVTDLRRDP